jgi:hypothetical protein
MGIGIYTANGVDVQGSAATNSLNTNLQGVATVKFNEADYTMDSFERLRVSEPRIAFESSFAIIPSSMATIWESTAYGAGTETSNTNSWVTDLNTTTATTTGRWIQSYNHIRYAPGISTLLRFTFCFNDLISNVMMRVGMFTDQGTFPSTSGDGVFLEASGAAISFVRRYLTSGAGQEERVAQASWNIDKMNGTGNSGINLDWTKAQHLVIEYQWLGVGTIRFGFETGGNGVVWAHQMISVNALTVPWGRTGTLPVRAECYTYGAAATAGKLTLINCVVQQEGDVKALRGWRYFSQNSGTTIKTVGTASSLYPILSLRALLTSDITKRCTFIPVSATITVATASTGGTSLQWALLAAPTPLTGATFAATASTSSYVGVDNAATATTAVTGTIIASGTLSNTVGTYNIDLKYLIDNAIMAGQNAAGGLTITGQNVLTLALGTLTGTTTVAPAVSAAINWKELI